jgi:hypothetical protein
MTTPEALESLGFVALPDPAPTAWFASKLPAITAAQEVKKLARLMHRPPAEVVRTAAWRIASGA